MRKIALDMNVSLNELGQMAETDNGEIDKKIDDAVKEAGNQEKTVIDSRLGFHWMPESFKVYLDLPPEVSAKRILHNQTINKLRAESEGIASEQEILQKITHRLASERKRYKELYGIEDHTAHSNFDLVIDTNENNLEQVAERVVREYKKWLAN